MSLRKYDDGETSNYDGRRVAIHFKYLIVHGNYNGAAGRTIVFTGSHNLSRSALVYNDETLVKIEHPDVSAGFRTTSRHCGAARSASARKAAAASTDDQAQLAASPAATSSTSPTSRYASGARSTARAPSGDSAPPPTIG